MQQNTPFRFMSFKEFVPDPFRFYIYILFLIFVKTEQRIPVKIVFTENNDSEILSQLVAGMNVECKVRY
jgi:hypothetical protein